MIQNTVLTPKIRQAIAEKITEMGLFLEGLKLVKAGKYSRLIIIIDLIDGTGLLDSEKLVQASRELSAFMDELDPVKGAYDLEISTPGAERKLETPRHFSRVKGRKIRVVNSEGKEFGGMLVEVKDETIVLQQGRESHEIFFEEIKKARVELEF